MPSPEIQHSTHQTRRRRRVWCAAIVVLSIAGYFLYRGVSSDSDLEHASADSPTSNERSAKGTNAAKVGGSSPAAHPPFGDSVTNSDSAPEPTARVTGRISNPDDEGIAGATVCALDTASYGGAIGSQRCSVSNGKGVYQISVAAGRYGLHAVADGYIPGRYQTPRTDGQVDIADNGHATGIDIRLEQGGVMLRGTIKDPYSGGVPNALVWWTFSANGPPPALQTRTNDNGEYELLVSPGPVGVMAIAEGYARGAAGGMAPGTLDVTLAPEAVVQGQVVEDASGRGLQNLAVTARGRDALGIEKQAEAATDAQGGFVFHQLEGGTYLFSVNSKGWQGSTPSWEPIHFSQHNQPIVVRVTRGARVEASVVSEDGPCPAGTVLLVEKEALVERSYSANIDQGRAVFEAVAAGKFFATVTCQGYIRLVDLPLIVTADDQRPTWKVSKGSSIRGTVVDTRGKGAAYVRVGVEPFRGLDGEPVDVTTGADGAFSVTGLQKGQYTVAVYDSERLERSNVANVSLQENSNAEVQLTLRAGAELQGKVVATGGGLAAAGATAIAFTEQGQAGQTWVDRAGEFHFQALPPGRYGVRICDGWAGLLADTGNVPNISLTQGRVAQVNLSTRPPGGVIAGRVVTERGIALDDALVSAEPEPSDAQNLTCAGVTSPRPKVQTQPDGRFTLPPLPDAVYRLTAVTLTGRRASYSNVTPGSNVTLEAVFQPSDE